MSAPLSPSATSPDNATDAAGVPSGFDLVEHLLGVQQSLSAVEEFSRVHDEHLDTGTGSAPDQARYYSSLLPATPPQEGEQYAFEVDLDLCSGCKACVTACHALNGLDDHESWRDVGLLVGGTEALPVMQHITTACHHCLEPPCMLGCPVNAYEKDPVTGIVKHLDDQCFGCQYCTLACPYDVPKYHADKGIVRKCDMCSDRLADGEAPACVQACPHEAISIRTVSRDEIVEESETSLFLPGAHDPQYTLPTTRYKTDRVLPRNLLPGDYYKVQAEHAHWALVIMLVLTQLSVGAFLCELLVRGALETGFASVFRPVQAVCAVAFGLLAISASTLHLGRPQYAFRAFIGLRHSWLSREILAFGLFAPLSIGYAGLIWLRLDAGLALGVMVTAVGLAGVFCSAMIYAVTQRVFWNLAYSTFKFFGTTLILGLSITLGSTVGTALAVDGYSVAAVMEACGDSLCRWLLLATTFKLTFELLLLGHLSDRRHSPMKRTAQLMLGPLRNWTSLRIGAGAVGGLVLPGVMLTQDWTTASPVLAGVLLGGIVVGTLLGEIAERYLFFTAVVRSKMPGGLTP